MPKKEWMFFSIVRLTLAGFAIVLLMGCKGPQGPTWKEQVSESLRYYYQGEEELRKGNFEAAEREYEAALKISPRPITYVRLAQIKNHNGDIAGALASVEEALRLAPEYQRAVVFKQQILLRQKGTEDSVSSVDAVDSSIISQPQASTADQEETEQKLLQSLIEEKPTDPEASEEDQTKSVVESSMESAPVPSPKTTLSEAVEEAFDANISETDLQKGQTIPADPEMEKAHKEANEALASGDWVRAQSLYEKVLATDLKDAFLCYHYGYACFQLNQFEKAETALRQAIELDPTFADAYNDLGVTLEKMHQSGEAMKAYQKAVDIGGNNDAFFNLALLKEKQGQYKTSVELYEKYLERDNNSTFSTFARQRIEKLRRLAY